MTSLQASTEAMCSGLGEGEGDGEGDALADELEPAHAAVRSTAATRPSERADAATILGP